MVKVNDGANMPHHYAHLNTTVHELPFQKHELDWLSGRVLSSINDEMLLMVYEPAGNIHEMVERMRSKD